MCELFAMSSRYPTSVGFSLETLARRGGHDGPHKDGWGVAYFEDHDVFLLRESSPAAESGLVRFMEKNGSPSNLVLSHIRLATQGEADSEFAFCCLLERLESLWNQATESPPSVDARLEIVADFATWLRPLGPFNFVCSDGDTLFVHAHRRLQSDGDVRPPGLHLLVRSCNEQAVGLSVSGILLSPVAQELALVASVPLTDEPWEPVAEGEVIALTQGVVWARMPASPITSG